jgi:Mg-chelatase subunit ChlD
MRFLKSGLMAILAGSLFLGSHGLVADEKKSKVYIPPKDTSVLNAGKAVQFIVDNSRDTEQIKLDEVKKSLSDTISTYSHSEEKPLSVGLIYFEKGKAVEKFPLAKLDKSGLLRQISELKAGGTADLGTALAKAEMAIDQTKFPERYIFIVTDGEGIGGENIDKVIDEIFMASIDSSRRPSKIFVIPYGGSVERNYFAPLRKYGGAGVGIRSALDGIELTEAFREKLN